MKHTKAKYVVAAIATSGIALTSMAGSCFAATNNPQTSKIFLTSPATSIDFTVEDIYMDTQNAGSTDASVSNVIITNNLSGAPIYVSRVVATGTGDYTITGYASDFSTYPIDSKMFALALNNVNGTSLDSPIDLSAAYDANQQIAARGNLTFGLTGKASLTSTALDKVQVGNFEVTVGSIPSPNPEDLVIDPDENY